MKRLGLVVFPGFQILDLAAASVFEVANLFASRPTYEVGLYSEQGGRVASSSGIEVETRKLTDPVFDTLIVTGDIGVSTPSEGLVRSVSEAHCQHLHRSIHIGCGGFVEWTSCHDALGQCTHSPAAVPGDPSRGRPHFHHGWKCMDVRRNDSVYRPVARAGGGGPGI
jgi:hypothetical protein